MKKNISKKVIVLLSLSFILLNNRFVLAEDVILDVFIDNVIPVISLIGDSNISISVGDTYIDAGAIAQDDKDGDITSSLIVVNNVDTTKSGNYSVTYNVKDKTLNSAIELTRTVTVKDIDIPDKLKEQVIIRNGDIIIYNGYYNLPDIGTINISDKDNVEHSIDKRSVLSVLYGIDQISDNFSISNLDYNSSFGSLYMKCLKPDNVNEVCDDWQYVVNDLYPQVGMDKNILLGNEKIYIYFGPQNKIILNNNSITTEDKLVVTAKKYDYINNIWTVRSGITIGVTLPDPNNPWSPNDDIKQLVDGITGEAKFSSIPVGTYNIGVKEDYYWPTESLIVSLPVVSNGGSSGFVDFSKTFSVKKAFEFLLKNEQSDGSFGNDMYTDWVAIGVAAGDNQNIKNNITNYFRNNSFSSQSLTDNERHAMALMSLGINPYSDKGINYIKKIIDSFDGTQFGDVNLYNDDIFALIVLKNAGYKSNDDIIKKDIKYLMLNQMNGSLTGVDITAALIQSLRGFEDIDGVREFISKGESYIVATQGSDSGFDNSFSTSWVLQSMFNNNKVLKSENYLALKQSEDGGMENIDYDINSRIWSTSYAIPAILHKPWSEILSIFPKQQDLIVPIPENKNLEREIPKKELDVNKLTEKEINASDVKSNFIQNTDLIKKDKNIRLKKMIVLNKRQSPQLKLPLKENLISLNNTDVKPKKISLIIRVWQAIKAPFSLFLFNLGF